MDIDFIRNRITELRMKKDISEHRMSLDLGHSRSYVHGIVAGKSLPSMTEFLSLCEYLEVSPDQFFNVEQDNPVKVTKLLKAAKDLDEDDLDMLIGMAERMKR